jgi:hypothetical protein
VALRKRSKAIKPESGQNPYNTKTYKVKTVQKVRNKRNPVKFNVISRTHIPHERINQKKRCSKLALKEKTHKAVRIDENEDPYNTRTYKVINKKKSKKGRKKESLKDLKRQKLFWTHLIKRCLLIEF